MRRRSQFGRWKQVLTVQKAGPNCRLTLVLYLSRFGSQMLCSVQDLTSTRNTRFQSVIQSLSILITLIH